MKRLFGCLLSAEITMVSFLVAQTPLPESNQSYSHFINSYGQNSTMIAQAEGLAYNHDLRATALLLELKAEQLRTEMAKQKLEAERKLIAEINKQKQINQNLQNEISHLNRTLNEEPKHEVTITSSYYMPEETQAKSDAQLKREVPQQLSSHVKQVHLAIEKARSEIDALIQKEKAELARTVLYDEKDLASFPVEKQRDVYLYIDSEIEAYKKAVLQQK